MLPVALLGLALAVVAQGDDPKPPWQRLLTGDYARKAADLGKQIVELEAVDKYSEAIRLREELLALRTRVQGAEHWEAINAKWELAAAKAMAALPEEKRAGWRQAGQGAAAAERLEQQGQYTRALPLWRERLKWCREVLGEDYPHTASAYNNVAANLQAQGRYAEAGPLFQKALDTRRKALGEEHPKTAQSYNNLAANLADRGKYTEAGLLHQKALDTWRQALGEEHPGRGSCAAGSWCRTPPACAS
jgi:tetratricopeptide (TPR) repeat protein